MRRLWVALAIVGSGCVGVDTGNSSHDLLPLEDGRALFFSTPQGFLGSISISGPTDEVPSWRLDFENGYAGKQRWLLTRSDEGVFLATIFVGHGFLLIDPPLLLAPRSVREGVPWSSKGKPASPEGFVSPPEMSEMALSTEGRSTSEPLEVNGRSYTCRRVDLRIVARQGEVKTQLWLAPGIGIVRLRAGPLGANAPWPADSWDLGEVSKRIRKP